MRRDSRRFLLAAAHGKVCWTAGGGRRALLSEGHREGGARERQTGGSSQPSCTLFFTTHFVCRRPWLRQSGAGGGGAIQALLTHAFEISLRLHMCLCGRAAVAPAPAPAPAPGPGDARRCTANGGASNPFAWACPRCIPNGHAAAASPRRPPHVGDVGLAPTPQPDVVLAPMRLRLRVVGCKC